jgi:hypothetical protein
MVRELAVVEPLTCASGLADARSAATTRNDCDKGAAMRLTFLGKDSVPDQSPTLYATDLDSYVVQGWIVTDPQILAMITVSDGETVVEVPAKLMAHLAKDGLAGEVVNLIPPVVHVTPDGNFIVQGQRVTDQEALGQMSIPDHETCVEVSRPAIVALVGS